MIESHENALQIAVLAVCLAVSVSRAVITKKKEWILLSFFLGSWVLADLYWVTFLIFLDRTPDVFYVSQFSWYASYIFLFLLLRQVLPQEKGPRSFLPWIGPIFAAGTCAFFMQWGAYAENLICAFLMGLLIFYAIRGLVLPRGAEDKKHLSLCVTVLVFCALEYALWTASCFWEGDSFANPYYWMDTLLTLSFIPLVFAVGRAVKE